MTGLAGGHGFTPGPWKVSLSGGAVLSDWRERLDDGKSLLPFASAVNPICWTHDTDIPLEQRQANARLISAAPDLLAVVMDIVLTDTVLRYGLLPQARAAINKALGIKTDEPANQGLQGR